ncbi:unnamed protein product [Owenia fusiformis]|uniref:Uncharacterized protein n=1 Tax=Owenia fusiformis TaxID=6347 RepID=A0A8J1U5P1_OWEFU|nr:unnamed protein product [Owenia fusiformis]
MSANSPFTISTSSASHMVREQRYNDNESHHCYILHISFQPVYTPEGSIPLSSYKKIPRIVNGIPFGAGRTTGDQSIIKWRYIEGGKNFQTFVSLPISLEDAEDTRMRLKDRLITQSRDIFADVTVRATVMLSRCVHYDADFLLNDLADPLDETLHFHD